MHPQLALIICTIFVLFLLHLERKQSPEVSFALWIPTIWMLLIASKPLGIWFHSSGATMTEGSALDRAGLTAILCLGLIILAKRKFNWSKAIKENIWLMLLIGYMLVSIIWSEMQFISFKRWIRELIAIVMAFMVATEAEPHKALQSIFRRTIYIHIPFSYILIHYFPEYGRQYADWSGMLMWIGVATQKNGLARFCLFTVIFLIWMFIRRRQGHDIPVIKYQILVEVFILILTIWLFMGPQHTLFYSATSAVVLAVGLMTLIGILWMKKRGILISANTLAFVIIIIIVYSTITFMVGGLRIFDISSAIGREETLTGRTYIWSILVPYTMQKPIWGHGFGGFWTDAMREISSSNAHNGYLDVLLNLGFFGLLLFAIFFLSCSRKAQRLMSQDFDWGNLFICFLLMTLLHNIAESSLNSFSNHLMAVVLFLTVSFTTPTSYTLKVSK